MSKRLQDTRGSVLSKSGAGAGQGARGLFSAYPRGAASAVRKGPCASPHTPERGSALLIVLGFLSFLIISAVSFAIYMRIERQASSNYRHSVTARHLLNAGLYRAIDEIDGELRIPSVSGVARPLKFPDWPGRVRPSAVANGAENGKDARVLSLEALSFIPAIFVNDVRRYAVTNRDDVVSGVNLSAGKYSYMGAKWRPLSMPIEFNSGRNASGGAEVGRYAYVCVNLSDMLDVNACDASADGTNRISIGHLFGNTPNAETDAKTFDNNKKNVDRRYETLQDFYACMNARNDLIFGSPYHELLKTGDDTAFDDAVNHVLTTDSIVKPEFVKSAQPCNIVEHQPVAAGVLSQKRVTSAALQAEFQTALGNALVGGLQNQGDLMATMIADYLDTDSIPKRLNVPTVEMVPMISQILVPSMFAPIILQRTVPSTADPARTKIVYSLQLIQGAPSAAIIDVEVVWPFKNQKSRTSQPAFTLEVIAYVKVIKEHAPLNSASINQKLIPGLAYKQLTSQVAIPDFWNENTEVPANCYKHVPVRFSVNPADITFDIIDSEDAKVIDPNAFPAVGNQFSVAVVVYARVKQGDEYVDCVPKNLNTVPALGTVEPIELKSMPKIFFQTVPRMVQASMQVGPMDYEWKCLEVPDPRFNHKVDNWVRNAAEEGNSITPGVNPSTTALLGQEGRDGDIYMSVSDTGEMQSPGELGFIVRPFPYTSASSGAGVDFRSRTVDDVPDKDYMFRTIRLYDHGGTGAKEERDKIYEHFIVRNPDGTLPGGTRVNPLSDLPQVLAAAVQNTPVDYYNAREKAAGRPNLVFNEADGALGLKADWAKFTNNWFTCLQNAKTASSFNTSLSRNLSDEYGRQDLFGWYTSGDATKVFQAAPGYSQTLSEPLHEIDRKMLFDYTLNNFSDRQQLFLYILRAEATVPSFGGSEQGGVRSVAGGRAVALVWRDPYPRRTAAGSVLTVDCYTDNRRVSPWYQHNNNRYDDQKDEADLGPDGNDVSRSVGYHDHRILFFKQLDN